MATNTHSELIPAEVHAPYRQIFANAAARTGDGNESLEITVTGEASKTIQWHATILSSESGNSAV